MHDFKTCTLVAPHGSCMPLVTRLAFSRDIFENNFRRLKDLNRQRVRAVLANRFEEAWDERRSDDLKFECLRIGNLNRGVIVVFMIQPFEILFVRALQQFFFTCVRKAIV